MSTQKFKTNINCTGCLSKVTPVLNKEGNIENWEVDLEHDDRILTVESKNLHQGQVIDVLDKIGFKAVPVS